jgi:hypothetical protein
MEGLLNYVYYQAGALNQFDLFGHLLHFSLFDVGVGPCGSYNAGENPSDDNPPPGNDSIGVPKAGGGTTTSLDNADPCVSWIGPTQPGINANPGLTQISPYDPSVCPQGSTDTTLCNPAGSKTTSQTSRSRTAPQGSGTTTTPATTPTGPAGSGGQTTVPDLPNPLGGGGNHLPGGLGGLLGLGHHHRGHHGLPGLGGGGGGGLLGGGRNASGPSTHAAQDLLNFLFSN